MDMHERISFYRRFNLFRAQVRKERDEELSGGLRTYFDGMSESRRPLWTAKELGRLGRVCRTGGRKAEPREHPPVGQKKGTGNEI